MKTAVLISLLTLSLSPEARSAQAALIYAPEGSETQEGNSFLLAPLVPNGGPRYQQVYNASMFAPFLPVGGGWVEDIVFRADGPFGGNFNVDVPNFAVILSTTTHSADGLSSVFDENLGPDQSVVFGPGPLHILSSHNQNHPQPFTIGFTLSHPFFYNPAAGNLLMEIRSLRNGQEMYPQVFLDAVDIPGDSISSLGGLPANPVGAPATVGLVTKFVFLPVPEPSSLTFCTLALGLLGVGWKWMRRKAAK